MAKVRTVATVTSRFRLVIHCETAWARTFQNSKFVDADMSDDGEIRPVVVNTTKVQGNMDDDNDSSFIIARDHAWAQSAEGNFLLGVEISGAALPSSHLTSNWVTHPFGEIRLNDYASFPEHHCSELVAFIRLREASRGVAASR